MFQYQILPLLCPVSTIPRDYHRSPYVRGSGNFLLKESRISLTIGLQNLSSSDIDWNRVPGIQNPKLSWILIWGDRDLHVLIILDPSAYGFGNAPLDLSPLHAQKSS